jgi:hypothetical protein
MTFNFVFPRLWLIDLAFFQPHGYRLWPHRFLHNLYQLACQAVYVDFVSGGGCKPLQGLGGIVFAPVEAPVDAALQAAAQRLE